MRTASGPPPTDGTSITFYADDGNVFTGLDAIEPEAAHHAKTWAEHDHAVRRLQRRPAAMRTYLTHLRTRGSGQRGSGQRVASRSRVSRRRAGTSRTVGTASSSSDPPDDGDDDGPGEARHHVATAPVGGAA